MRKLYWDIETEGLPFEQVAKLMPEFEAPGNIKDPEKIKAVIEGKKSDWIEGLALKAITGRIVAVTIAQEGEPNMNVADEKNLIIATIDLLQDENTSAYAWNGSGFDLPFLCQRAAVYGIPAFAALTTNVKGRFYWRENLIDPKLVWSNYSPDHTGTSLKSVAYSLGVGEKMGNGKDFAALLKTNPKEAEQYANKDVTLLRGIVQRMGI